jgi:putative flippase GtrA
VTSRSRRLLGRLRLWYDLLAREVAKFGVVGLCAFVLDTALYNYFVFGLPGTGEAGLFFDMPLRGKIAATAFSTTFAWAGNRYWTFRHRRRTARAHEFALFVLANIIGLAIALACLGFSRYALGLDSQLADNVSGNGIGLVLGTLFRFWAYRTYVFSPSSSPRSPAGPAASERAPSRCTAQTPPAAPGPAPDAPRTTRPSPEPPRDRDPSPTRW